MKAGQIPDDVETRFSLARFRLVSDGIKLECHAVICCQRTDVTASKTHAVSVTFSSASAATTG